ncbi:MAG: 50S ribosomal protein L21 [Proteobacteria bacterium]|nr:50S ribosomal protein L21 [Pseudomonadota bacterium]
MFAVIRSGGKQYRVAPNDVIEVEKLAAGAGEQVTFAEVLMVADGATRTVGAPLVAGAAVAGTVLAQRRTDKIIVFKKPPRAHYRRKKGHRQALTLVQVDEILTEGRQPTPRAKPEPKAEAAPETAPGPAAAGKAGPKAAARPTRTGAKPKAKAQSKAKAGPKPKAGSKAKAGSKGKPGSKEKS